MYSATDVGVPDAGVRRLLRTLSTVSIYESGEGRAGGLADVAPIGRYITQDHRTGDDALASEMPKEIMEGGSGGGDGEKTEGGGSGEGSGGEKGFRV